MPNIPNDPIMLMSYLNTQLRDNYASLEELCRSFFKITLSRFMSVPVCSLFCVWT